MKHILLVEDEIELAQLVRDYLEAAGFEVSMFHDGQEAYDSFLQRKPPNGECAKLNSPPNALAILTDKARPKPVPPVARVRESSAR